MSTSSPRRGFTLVELLVVISIIALLISILLPVMSRVRVAANRTTCAAQLRDLGSLFQMYLNDSKGRLPGVNYFPGETDPAFNPVLNEVPVPPTLWSAFASYTKLNLEADPASQFYFRNSRRNIWMCPGDRVTPEDTRPASKGLETYYDTYGTSYEYNIWLNTFYGMPAARQGKLTPPNAPFREALGDAERRNITPDKFRIFNDFTYFHGKKGTLGNMNFLFADWHVSDLAGSSSGQGTGASGR